MKKSKKEFPQKDRKKIKSLESQFAEVSGMILAARQKAFQIVDSTLVKLYWNIGEYISDRVERSGWGENTVEKLSEYLEKIIPEMRGFSRRGLYRMKQFYETYVGNKKVSPLVTQIQWSNHLVILSATKTIEEKEFYLQLCIREKYSKREIQRQIESGLFERVIYSPAKLSGVLKQQHPSADVVLRDSYSLDFLGLSDDHSEYDLRKGIVHSLKRFIVEFGRDFAFVGEEYRLQVGLKDYYLDLLFYHRELQCLVAFELKIDEFKPEHLGKLSFYLEALDRDVKKPHEKPSIGIILCKGKNDEIVEYSLGRTLSPAAIADYTTKLPDKKLLQSKLHEFFNSSMNEVRAEYIHLQK